MASLAPKQSVAMAMEEQELQLPLQLVVLVLLLLVVARQHLRLPTRHTMAALQHWLLQRRPRLVRKMSSLALA